MASVDWQPLGMAEELRLLREEVKRLRARVALLEAAQQPAEAHCRIALGTEVLVDRNVEVTDGR